MFKRDQCDAGSTNATAPTFRWSFGEAAPGNPVGARVSRQFMQPGRFVVTLEVSAPEAETQIFGNVIIVEPPEPPTELNACFETEPCCF